MSKKTSLIILILATIVIHFAFFGRPNETVFDEVHFGKFVSAYYTHQYYFDIHPPGGKLIIAGFAKLFNFSPEYSFAEIGQPFPDNKYLALRFLPIVASALLPIVIYFLALELGLSVLGALGAGLMVSLENALVTHSRLILLDPFLLLFGFSALLFYFKYRSVNQHWKLKIVNWNLLLMAVFGGLAMSIKWTGIAFLGLAGIIELIDLIRAVSWKRIANLILYFAFIPLIFYFLIFVIHFSLLTKTGDGDAFMTPAFQNSLQNSYYAGDLSIKPLNIFQKFTELNVEMYQANKGLTAAHPYSSQWYTWPFLIRPIYYWNQSSSTVPAESKIYLLGNPVIWWASTVGVMYLLLSIVGKDLFKKKIPLILLGGWLVNYLPFIGIGRVMFLYHYFAALIFAILILVYMIDQSHNRRNIFIGLLIAAGAAFLYFAPLTYGFPLETHAFQNRMWLSSWQ